MKIYALALFYKFEYLIMFWHHHLPRHEDVNVRRAAHLFESGNEKYDRYEY